MNETRPYNSGGFAFVHEGIAGFIDRHGFVSMGGCGFHIEESTPRFQISVLKQLRAATRNVKSDTTRNELYRLMAKIPD